MVCYTRTLKICGWYLSTTGMLVRVEIMIRNLTWISDVIDLLRIRHFWSLCSFKNLLSCLTIGPNISNRKERNPRLVWGASFTRNSSIFFWHETSDLMNYWVVVIASDIVGLIEALVLIDNSNSRLVTKVDFLQLMLKRNFHFLEVGVSWWDSFLNSQTFCP